MQKEKGEKIEAGMDHQKKHNGWLTFIEHWGFLVMILVMAVLAAIILPLVSRSHKTVKAIESDDFYGDLASDTNSVFWNILSAQATNQIQFVLMLPATTSIGSGSKNHVSWVDDFCNLQIKSNGHHWRIENLMHWQTGVQNIDLWDLTADKTGEMKLDTGRFWQLDEDGNATPLENIDPAIMNKIFNQVQADETNQPLPQSP